MGLSPHHGIAEPQDCQPIMLHPRRSHKDVMRVLLHFFIYLFMKGHFLSTFNSEGEAQECFFFYYQIFHVHKSL